MPKNSFLSKLSAPACRALRNQGIETLEQLAQYSESEIMGLHGLGKASIPKLKDSLSSVGLVFKSN